MEANLPDEYKEPDIGSRMRQRRTELGLSLRQLAEKTGLTSSFLGQVERGEASPSISSLRRIASVLKVSIMRFLIERPAAGRVVRADQRARRSLPDIGATYELITPDLNRKMEILLTRRAPGGKGMVVSRLSESTEECIFVLSGKVLVKLEDGDYHLDQGDSIYYEGAEMLAVLNASETEVAEWLFVITPSVF